MRWITVRAVALGMLWIAAGVAMVFAGLTLFAGLAWAHEEAPSDVRVVLDRINPAAEGLRVQVYDDQIAPQVVLENDSGRTLEVLDEWGRAFLRIGPEGVEADVASPSWYRTLSPDGVLASPAATTTSTPEWRKVRSQPSWGWFDRRLDAAAAPMPETVAHTARTATLASWHIAARLDGTPVDLQGHFQYAPARAGLWRVSLTPARWSGVSVMVSQGRPPALMLENTGAPVTVLGAQDEPFIRIGRDGVEVNLASPTWQDQGRYRGLAPEALAGAETWQKVSSAPRYSWIEPRIERAGKRRWQIPVEIDGRRQFIKGVREWVPVQATAARVSLRQ